MLKINKFIIVTALVSMVSGCNITPYNNNKSEESEHHTKIAATNNILVPTNNFLKNTTWKLIQFNDDVVPKSVKVNMTFQKIIAYENEKLLIKGKGTCNSYNAEISINVNKHNFEFLDGRFMNDKCYDPTLRKIEKKFFYTLKNNRKIEKHSHNHIIMEDDLNTFVFKRAK